jgi:hypothetical protein
MGAAVLLTYGPSQRAPLAAAKMSGSVFKRWDRLAAFPVSGGSRVNLRAKQLLSSVNGSAGN